MNFCWMFIQYLLVHQWSLKLEKQEKINEKEIESDFDEGFITIHSNLLELEKCMRNFLLRMQFPPRSEFGSVRIRNYFLNQSQIWKYYWIWIRIWDRIRIWCYFQAQIRVCLKVQIALEVLPPFFCKDLLYCKRGTVFEAKMISIFFRIRKDI